MNVNPMLKSRLRTLSGLILVWLASPLPAQELDARSVHFWCAIVTNATAMTRPLPENLKAIYVLTIVQAFNKEARPGQ